MKKEKKKRIKMKKNETVLESSLHLWFGLSYASFLTLPRVLMQEMSLEWQEEMAKLLKEYDEEFPNKPEIGTRVQITRNNKLIKIPDWLINYRRPDKDMIDKLKGKNNEIY
jgi:hypothetical protein